MGLSNLGKMLRNGIIKKRSSKAAWNGWIHQGVTFSYDEGQGAW
jgi:hypothetical protein